MANVLPQKERRNIKMQYKLRFTAMTFLALSAGFAIGVAVLLPQYLYLNGKLSGLSVAKGTKFTKAQQDEYKTAQHAVKRTAKQIARIKSQAPVRVSSYVADVVGIRVGYGRDILITGFNYDTAKGERRLRVSGTASNRNILAKFKTSLMDLSFAKSVTLPVKDLTKNTDIPFAITILLKQHE